MLTRFVNDPRATPDTTCLADLVPVDFTGGDPTLVQQLFGTDDAWENDRVAVPAPLGAARPLSRIAPLEIPLTVRR
jgi:hypothetical protein